MWVLHGQQILYSGSVIELLMALSTFMLKKKSYLKKVLFSFFFLFLCVHVSNQYKALPICIGTCGLVCNLFIFLSV